MNEFISRNALLDAMPKNDELSSLDVRKVICSVPTADVILVRHGRWEWHETWSDETHEAPLELLDDGWTCSACGVYLMLYLQSHFPDIPSYAECASDEMPTVERCPCCGAKMDLEEPTNE